MVATSADREQPPTLPALEAIRDFNYSGSWRTSGLDLWQQHDHGRMAVEVDRGKRYFPGWNVARWWLSSDAFQRNPSRFLANFDAGLKIFSGHGIRVMPVLFNRWRDPTCDFDGVSIDHILMGFRDGIVAGADAGKPLDDRGIKGLWGRYLEAVVGGHADDDRVIAWDLCNEPLGGSYDDDPDGPIPRAELRWLSWSWDVCKAVGARQPLMVGCHPSLTVIRLTEPLADFVSFHPYCIPGLDAESLAHVGSPAQFERFLDDVVAFAAASGKGLLASETVWGAVDDAERMSILRYTLGQLVDRNVGFGAHPLHHSLVADLHSVECGPVGFPGRLEFINADGSLRTGREAFNDFVK